MAVVKDPGAEILGGDDLPEAAIDPNAPQIRVSHEYSKSPKRNISVWLFDLNIFCYSVLQRYFNITQNILKSTIFLIFLCKPTHHVNAGFMLLSL